jgi:hypothetical protein
MTNKLYEGIQSTGYTYNGGVCSSFKYSVLYDDGYLQNLPVNFLKDNQRTTLISFYS